MSFTDLYLHEQLMLLSLKDNEGTLVSGTSYTYAIGGAVLAELLMSERITIEGSGKTRRVHVLDARPCGDPLIDEWVGRMRTERRPRSMQDWVMKVAETKELKHRVAKQLCRRGILRGDEDKVLWIFTRKIYPEVDPGPERELIARLESVLFQGVDPDPRTAVLVALAHHSGVLRTVFDKKLLKEQKGRIDQIAEGSLSGEATKEAIEALQAAIMVAVVIPVIVTS